MQTNGVEIKYGRVELQGKQVGYCEYMDPRDNTLHQIWCPPYESLLVLVDGKKVKASRHHVMMWTKVAGWLGNHELLASLNR